MPDPFAKHIFTVTDLSRSIRGILETSFPFIAVTGEVSGLRRPLSGHCYFTLKDDGAQLRAVLFKQQQRYLQLDLKNGLQVLCRGRISVYEPRGEYQLIVDTVVGHGTGALHAAFEALKNRLRQEGLFDPERKQRLPQLPHRICLITSPDGAAVHDFIRTAQHRCRSVPIDILPVAVQGEQAAGQIAQAIADANAMGTADCIVLCRGGGSLEDLWPFNEEAVARAIADSSLPVITGIGHETDTTIADFAADYRALTPTAAAEAVLPSRQELVDRLGFLTTQLARVQHHLLATWRHRLTVCYQRLGTQPALLTTHLLTVGHYTDRLQLLFQAMTATRRQHLHRLIERCQERRPDRLIERHHYALAKIVHRLTTAIHIRLQRATTDLRHKENLLKAVNPTAILQRGFALVQVDEEQTLLRNASQVAAGDRLRITLAEGELTSTVLETNPPRHHRQNKKANHP